MKKEEFFVPDNIFEVSWEVCNKVGGIHTVVSTKAFSLLKTFKDQLIMIGPDVWRDPEQNPEFLEDKNLFRSWKEQAREEGLHIRIGRWNIAGRPIVIMVDFTPYISQKDAIFSGFWESFRLDSLSGAWDYIEPFLFGYAAGKVIESFSNFHTTFRTRIVAQFHEWMTGAGVLYLRKHAPQVATVFTTHATVMGRALAGNGFPLYQKLTEYNGDQKAHDFFVSAKQSLEKISAREADCFTTVSEITSRECAQFLEKEVDLVTPNGFEDNFVPPSHEFFGKRKEARKRFTEVASALLGQEVSDKAFLIGNSGRYEFRNKGIDLFIDALGLLARDPDLTQDVVAFILVPANHYGPRRELLNILAGQPETIEEGQRILTHGLHDAEYDPILKRIAENGLTNEPDCRVKVIFVPSYLNGNDGLFNVPYYDLLIGLDLTVFPSYYEPWGYTPLESLAFHVPTVTTSLAGFGRWVNHEIENHAGGIRVIERTDDNDPEVVSLIAEAMAFQAGLADDARRKAHEEAFEISRTALWKNLIKFYRQAYHLALTKSTSRESLYRETIPQRLDYNIIKSPGVRLPNLKKIMVQTSLPRRLGGLKEISRNLWWSWNYQASELFEAMDPVLWNKVRHNPIALLDEISLESLNTLEKDKKFLKKYDELYTRFREYMHTPKKKGPRLAYFSMEYGFSDVLKIYSGGLGILAGDYLKEASDAGVDLIGVGLLYRVGYFSQSLSMNGEQQVNLIPQKFSHLPVQPVKDNDGNWVQITISLPGRLLYAKVWEVRIGRNLMYLMDTEVDENNESDRMITHQLYGGDNEYRFKQEMVLGIGGIRLLHTLGIEPNLYHINEGHAAFIGLERLRELIVNRNFTFSESLEIVRASSLFTTHTPVPAGHDAFPEEMVRTYMSHYPDRLKISWEEFIRLGKVQPENKSEKFSMSFLAANLSQEVNGVSWLHGEVSKEIFVKLYEGYFPEELHVGYVTNGVHYPSWTARVWREMLEEDGADEFIENQVNVQLWEKINSLRDEEVWEIRQKQRKQLFEFIHERVNRYWIQRLENPAKLIEVQSKINEKTLTIAFARRFATYKRATLLFRNLSRLSRLLNNPEMPVQLLFAGKAHPHDHEGAELIRTIVEISNRPEFLGKILFLENYDIDLAKKMLQGVDVWLNNPTRPQEASGTSGMKAVMNGALHFSVLDGWWVEGFQEGAGWALPRESVYDNTAYQDELDAEMIYGILENQLVPLFYKRNAKGIPVDWVSYIRKSFSSIAPRFSTRRMLQDYQERFYNKLHDRTKALSRNDFGLAKEIAAWKKKFARAWDSVEVIYLDFPDLHNDSFLLGETYKAEVVLDLNEMDEADLGIELVAMRNDEAGKTHISRKVEFDLMEVVDRRARYQVEFCPQKPGLLSLGIRLFPKNDHLPHRMDFCYVRWL